MSVVKLGKEGGVAVHSQVSLALDPSCLRFQVTKIMVPHLRFYFHELVRAAAAEILPHLLECVKVKGESNGSLLFHACFIRIHTRCFWRSENCEEEGEGGISRRGRERLGGEGGVRRGRERLGG